MSAVHKILALVLLCGLATLSCTVPPPSGMMPGRAAVQKQWVFRYSFERVWQRLIYVLNERELPIKAIEKDSGVLTTDAVRFDPYSETGRCALAGTFWDNIREGRYSLNILVLAITDSTTSVRINVHTERFNKPFLGTYNWEAQLTTGCIEMEIFSKLTKALAGP